MNSLDSQDDPVVDETISMPQDDLDEEYEDE